MGMVRVGVILGENCAGEIIQVGIFRVGDFLVPVVYLALFIWIFLLA